MKNTILAPMLACAAIYCSVSLSAAQAPASGCASGADCSIRLRRPERRRPRCRPNSRWMVASGMAPGSGLHIVDTQAKTVPEPVRRRRRDARADNARNTRAVPARSIQAGWCCTA